MITTDMANWGLRPYRAPQDPVEGLSRVARAREGQGNSLCNVDRELKDLGFFEAR